MAAKVQYDSQGLKDCYLGPKFPNKMNRNSSVFNYDENLAPAYVPKTFFYFKEEADLTSSVDGLKRKLKVDLSLLKKIRKDIKNHVEYRIQIFLQQLILVFKTKLVFDFCNSAIKQIGSTVCDEANKNEEGDYAAAHGSTLPCLRILNEEDDDNSTIFGLGSSFERDWNATVFLPKVVNDIDSDFDKFYRKCNKEKCFRKISTEILNEVSSGKKTPKEGLKLFLENGLEYVGELLGKEEDEEKEYVLKIYKKMMEDYQEALGDEGDFFKTLCLRVDPRSTEEELTEDECLLKTQKKMHAVFKREMEENRPEEVELDLDGKDPTAYADKVEELCEDIELSKSQKKYKEIALLDKKVRTFAIQYLADISSSEELESDFQQLLKFKTIKTIDKHPLPDGILKIHDAVLEKISRDCSVKSPRSMNLIIVGIIQDIVKNPLLEV
jgi:hypothetical protein